MCVIFRRNCQCGHGRPVGKNTCGGFRCGDPEFLDLPGCDSSCPQCDDGASGTYLEKLAPVNGNGVSDHAEPRPSTAASLSSIGSGQGGFEISATSARARHYLGSNVLDGFEDLDIRHEPVSSQRAVNRDPRSVIAGGRGDTSNSHILRRTQGHINQRDFAAPAVGGAQVNGLRDAYVHQMRNDAFDKDYPSVVRPRGMSSAQLAAYTQPLGAPAKQGSHPPIGSPHRSQPFGRNDIAMPSIDMRMNGSPARRRQTDVSESTASSTPPRASVQRPSIHSRGSEDEPTTPQHSRRYNQKEPYIPYEPFAQLVQPPPRQQIQAQQQPVPTFAAFTPRVEPAQPVSNGSGHARRNSGYCGSPWMAKFVQSKTKAGRRNSAAAEGHVLSPPKTQIQPVNGHHAGPQYQY